MARVERNTNFPLDRERPIRRLESGDINLVANTFGIKGISEVIAIVRALPVSTVNTILTKAPKQP